MYGRVGVPVDRTLWSMLGQNRVIDKDVKRCTHCCYVRCMKFKVRVGGVGDIPWPQTDTTHYHAQLGSHKDPFIYQGLQLSELSHTQITKLLKHVGFFFKPWTKP